MKYDEDYYYNLLKMQAEHAKRISEIRWGFVHGCRAKSVLDYGCGVGFFKAFAPPGVEVDTYDIGPYVMTGMRHNSYNLLCLWDVIEHLPCIDGDLEHYVSISEYIALSIPMLPKAKKLEGWKHFKPGEHLHYFNDEAIDALFGRYNFKRIKDGFPECPPRVDVKSILYKYIRE